ncbi:MAG: nucleotidyltransferase domain-containing protein [Sphingobacteriia bacterium]|nr:nucleotidyltransferase domain-containing protein [Sphingobacteriia bacterium]
MGNISEKYFIKLCKDTFDDNLIYIINTDSYLRQPCYSSKARNYYYLILEKLDNQQLNALKYLQGEFPEFILNCLSYEELENYPSHSKWQFIFSPIIYNKYNVLIEHLNTQDYVDSIANAIINVGHIARLYYLSDLDDKSHTWAVRQLGWALRYAEKGIVNLWNYIQIGEYSNSNTDLNITGEIEWLITINNFWEKFEYELLQNIEEYKKASLILNRIVQYYSEKLATNITNSNFIEDSSNEYDESKFHFISLITNDLKQKFNDNLRTFYLYGSAARGEQHKTSDVDSIVVFDKLDDDTLAVLREIKVNHPNLSIYSLSINDLIIYPSFKYYTQNLGSKKIYGNISFKPANSLDDIINGMINNLFIIIQISRAYLIGENFGPRAIHLLKLMMKLADHGCMRLLINYYKKEFPQNKEEVKAFFKEELLANKVIDFVININDEADKIKASLLNGNNSLITENYQLLISFAKDFYSKVKKLKMEGNNYETSKL